MNHLPIHRTQSKAGFVAIGLCCISITLLPGCGFFFNLIFGNPGEDPNDFVPGAPLKRYQIDDFTGAGICADCHNNLTDAGGNDVSIPTDWRSTMMGNAGRDPFFIAKVSAEVARLPALSETIQAKCAACHMPIAETQAETNGDPVAIFGDGFLNESNPLHVPALEGVACSLCHQIQPDNLGDPNSFSGNYIIDTSTDVPDRVIFGPFPNPEPTLMREATGFTPQEGPHMLQADLCATCHTLYTPTVDADGNQVGTFPEQTPFLEWKHSSFGDGVDVDQSCQDCHMPVADGAVVISRLPTDGLTPREPFAQHHFVGGNTFMLKILRNNIEALDLTASTDNFDATIQRTLDQLQTRTATIAISAATIDADLLNVDVSVQNLAGHKFPTGYPSRRAWIHFTVVDANGETIFESGAPSANGSIGGNAADLDPAAFEPHYDLITDQGQVQIYEAVMADTDANITYTLLRADSYVKDNRLLPTGFDKATADADIAPAGMAAGDDDFVGGGDIVWYTVPVGGVALPLTVRTELLYQSLGYRFAWDLFGTNTPEVAAFFLLYDQADKSPVTIGVAETTVGG